MTRSRNIPEIAAAFAAILCVAPSGATPREVQSALPSVRPADVSGAARANAEPDAAYSDDASSDARAQGSAWLKTHRNPDGGWGAGSFGRSAATGQSDVATTALAIMALWRDGGREGRHAEAIERGLRFVLDRVEASPAEGPSLLGPSGTQPQRKLGRNVDTHFASLLFGVLDGHAPAELEARMQVAYDKVLSKVVAAQRADGSFDSDGWAPVLSSSVAARSLSRAAELGKPVSPAALAKSDSYQRRLVDEETGRFDASAGAGVDLYAAASTLSSNSDAARRARSGDERRRAQVAAEAAQQAMQRDGGRIIAGFGSIGGEEMLSYVMISDSLAREGADAFEDWQQRIGSQIVATQNQDGSWSGHHCITSTTFVTAAAVMTLAAGDEYAANQAALNASSGR